MKCLSPLVLALLSAGPAAAQLAPSEQTTQNVVTVTEAFFAQLQKDDFPAERAFLSEAFAAMLSAEAWAELRRQTTALAGPTPLFRPHRLTYYQQDTLLAAVDFWAPANREGTYICGYAIWSLPTADTIGLSRFEQNIVEATVFRAMDTQEALQVLTDWQCPPDVITAVLDLAIQD